MTAQIIRAITANADRLGRRLRKSEIRDIEMALRAGSARVISNCGPPGWSIYTHRLRSGRFEFFVRFGVAEDLRTAPDRSRGFCTPVQWRARIDYYAGCCYLCGVALTPQTLTVDHRIPRSRGGLSWPANLAPACRPCNTRKADRTEREYRRE